jgi:tetratricopeptide (TPR) repeat protein
MKWIFYVTFGALIAIGWVLFMHQGDDKIDELEQRIAEIERLGYQEDMEAIPSLKDQIEEVQGGKVLTGILMAFLTAGLVGIVFVIDILPTIAHKFTHAVYDSGEELEEDPMHDARALLAQGEYEAAIGAFRDAAAEDPLNRLPYVEISKIQRDHLHDPQAAIDTLREAIEGQEWQVSDAAFLMFRLAEVYDQAMEDRASAAAIMQQVVDQFPETRHSANARHKLHEWGLA